MVKMEEANLAQSHSRKDGDREFAGIDQLKCQNPFKSRIHKTCRSMYLEPEPPQRAATFQSAGNVSWQPDKLER